MLFPLNMIFFPCVYILYIENVFKNKIMLGKSPNMSRSRNKN